jgi:transketolase
MRNAFSKIVTDLAEINTNIVMLTGDIGNRLFDTFKYKYSNRFYNCGVAEAGMTGIAAGLASCGLQPLTYTITPFNTLRCLEQIRNDICYPNLPVIIVGTGSGLSYSKLGITHHSMEDIGVMRMLPNMHVVCPADPVEVKLAVADALSLKRPTYIRLGKKGEPIVHAEQPPFKIGKGITVRQGDDIVLLSVGNMLPIALECAELISETGASIRVVSLHTVKPLDEPLLEELFLKYKIIAVLEEHGLAGGSSSAILEWGNARRLDVRKICCFGGPDQFLTACGNQQQAGDQIGLNAATITHGLVKALQS